MKILVISSCPTHPTTAGNRKCVYDYCRMYQSKGHDVYYLLVNYEFKSRTFEYTNATKEEWGDHFFIYQTGMFHSSYKHFKNKWRKLFCNYSWKVDDWYPMGLKHYVNLLHKKIQFDSVIVNYVYLSKVLCGLNIQKKILYTHDSFTNKFLRVGREADFSIAPSEESKGLLRCDTILSIQENETVLFKYLAPKQKIYTTFAFFENNFLQLTGNNKLLFFSGLNPYNINGIVSFIENVMVKIHRINSDCELYIGGKICQVLSSLKMPSFVKLLGLFDNPQDFYSLGDIVINPVYQGSGLKIKTFEALSFGRITITSEHSSEGIFDRHESPIMIAHDAKDYINYIERLNSLEERVLIQKSIVQYMEKFQNYVIQTFENVI